MTRRLPMPTLTIAAMRLSVALVVLFGRQQHDRSGLSLVAALADLPFA